MKKIKVSEENTQVVNNDDYTIALLIDAENISYKYIPTLLEQLKSFGNITIRRVYGDFTSQILKPWKEICNEFSIKPIQGNVISTGKNNSDSVLIIDAMDILHDHRVDAFCLATSDSDFTSLAIRIREDGYFVIGAGEDKTSKAFIETCARFIRLGEEKQISKPKKSKTNSKSKSSSKKNEADSRKNLFPDLSEEDMKKIDEIKARSYLILENRGNGDYIKLSVFINDLYRYYPDYTPKDFGCNSNQEFFKKLGFDVIFDEKGAMVIR